MKNRSHPSLQLKVSVVFQSNLAPSVTPRRKAKAAILLSSLWGLTLVDNKSTILLEALDGKVSNLTASVALLEKENGIYTVGSQQDPVPASDFAPPLTLLPRSP